MNLQEHRIYKHLSAPFRIVGLTLDEIAMGIGGFVAFNMIQKKAIGTLIFGLSIVSIYIWKKVKKQAAGFSFLSFVNWHFGGEVAGIGKYWPASYERRWLV